LSDRTKKRVERREAPGEYEGRGYRVLVGRICSVVGMLLGVGGILAVLLEASVDVSAGVVGAALGVVGYFLGSRRLGAATVVVGVTAVLFVAAVTAGLIPGLESPDHGYQD
jgi:site-specific recombinase